MISERSKEDSYMSQESEFSEAKSSHRSIHDKTP